MSTFLSFSYDFMLTELFCKGWGHFVMSIIQFMHLISVCFWTYLVQAGVKQNDFNKASIKVLAISRFLGRDS